MFCSDADIDIIILAKKTTVHWLNFSLLVGEVVGIEVQGMFGWLLRF